MVKIFSIAWTVFEKSRHGKVIYEKKLLSNIYVNINSFQVFYKFDHKPAILIWNFCDCLIILKNEFHCHHKTKAKICFRGTLSTAKKNSLYQYLELYWIHKNQLLCCFQVFHVFKDIFQQLHKLNWFRIIIR